MIPQGKKCIKCFKFKPSSEYFEDDRYYDGLSKACKTCPQNLRPSPLGIVMRRKHDTITYGGATKDLSMCERRDQTEEDKYAELDYGI